MNLVKPTPVVSEGCLTAGLPGEWFQYYSVQPARLAVRTYLSMLIITRQVMKLNSGLNLKCACMLSTIIVIVIIIIIIVVI
jgi:hypothetical protein